VNGGTPPKADTALTGLGADSFLEIVGLWPNGHMTALITGAFSAPVAGKDLD
jgi:hypothetical protein